jgi:hypothetical protein
VSDTLKRTWNQTVESKFEYCTDIFMGRPSKVTEDLSQVSRCPVRALNPRLPEYKAGMLTSGQLLSVNDLKMGLEATSETSFVSNIPEWTMFNIILV